MAAKGSFKLYGMTGSGNCEKVRIVADLLGLDYEWIETRTTSGDTKTEAFLRDVNPTGQVPAVVFADGERLAQSNAITLHLAEGSPLIPASPLDRARMLAWMFWEQNAHEPSVAVCRAEILFRGKTEADLDPRLRAAGEAALAHLDAALDGRLWLVGDTASLADVTLYPYTRDAPEGRFDLSRHANVTAWLARARQAFVKVN